MISHHCSIIWNSGKTVLSCFKVEKKGKLSTCNPALSSWRTRPSRSWAGKWRAPTSSSPSLCRVMVILRSCLRVKKHVRYTCNALSEGSHLKLHIRCVISPCYPPEPPPTSESAPSPPQRVVSLVPSSLSTAEPGSPEKRLEKKSEI